MTEAQLAQLVINLRKFEGAVPWMYRDNAPAGNITVGIGVMLPDASAAVALPFVNLSTGQAATASQVSEAFARVKAMEPGHAASYYKGVTDIELPPEEVTALAERRLNDVFLPGLQSLYRPGIGAGFDALPFPAQQVLVDMAWNLGLTGLGKFHNLLAAVGNHDWRRAAGETHVATSRPERNAWRLMTMLEAAG